MKVGTKEKRRYIGGFMTDFGGPKYSMSSVVM